MANFQPTANQGELDSGWIAAPADSHVESFRLLDRGGSEFGAASEIRVRFKATKTQPTAEYAYTLSSHDVARAVFGALEGAASPGTVIDAQLKKTRTPYRRIS
jgi:hypothetical protein